MPDARLQRIYALADAIDASAIDPLPPGRIYKLAREIRVLALELMRDGGGVRSNPPLVIFGNPGRGNSGSGALMSKDVLAVLYKHRDDGEFYIHGFGDASLKLKGSPSEGVSIGGLKERTGVQMTANPDGSITLHHKSHKLWGEF